MQFHFGNNTLDTGRRELRRGGELIPLEPQVFDLLLYLIQHRNRVVSKDELFEAVWLGRIVSDSTLTSRIASARKAIGDDGEQQRIIRTMPRRGIRFIAEVVESAPGEAATPMSARLPRASAHLSQKVQFCITSDGVRIAYATVGSGPMLVKTANYLTHLEYDWQSPVWSPFLNALAQRHCLTRYDSRGNGLSDWDVDDISFDAFVRDLETVVDTANLPKFSLLGISQGCAVAVAYAVKHSERVSNLVLYGGYSRGKRRRGSTTDIEQSDALLTLMRDGWGRDNPAFRQVFTSLFIPGGTNEQVQWWDDLQRKTTSPANAVRIRRACDDIDVTDLLSRVECPTLVLHCREDAAQPFDEGRRLAAGIRGARFVALEGRNHVILKGDPCWDRFLQEIDGFLP